MFSCRESIVVLGDLLAPFNHLEVRGESFSSVCEDFIAGVDLMESGTEVKGVLLCEITPDCDDSLGHNEGHAELCELIARSGEGSDSFECLTGEVRSLDLGDGKSGGFGLCLGI